MKLKTRHTIILALKNKGYSIETSHIWKNQPNTLCIVFDLYKSKTKSFSPIRNVLKKINTNEFLQINVGWSEHSIKKEFGNKPIFGCVSTGFDMGPTKEMSVYHVDNPHWEHC